jgi:hypothetical protein
MTYLPTLSSLDIRYGLSHYNWLRSSGLVYEGDSSSLNDRT